MEYRIYRDKKGDWRWHLRAKNGRIVADSAEGYRRKIDCVRAIDLVRQSANVPIVARKISRKKS